MSMMAEPRRRRKWTLNPRGTIWANDDNKYGQKLMEKMGWTKGSGLGREEQGIKEHLAVKFKDDSKGIGYKGSDDEWIKHYEGFENVLASLNSQDNNTGTGNGDDELPGHNTVSKTSLESSSKASRARVHYHKFTRGKDLSRCSDDDLGCILGSKRAKQLAAEEAGSETGDAVGTVHHSMGVTTIKGCSIQDYFARKMESLRNHAKSQPQTLEGENECGSEECVGRPGLGVSRGGGEDTPDSPAAEEEDGEKKKKKKKRKKQQVEAEEINAGESGEKCEDFFESENIPKKKKKKKRQESIEFSAVDGITGESAALKGTKKLLCASNEDDVEEPGKRKKKRKHTNTIAEEQTLKAVMAVEENPEIKRKKWIHTNIVNRDYSSHDEVNKYPEVAKKKKKRKDKST